MKQPDDPLGPLVRRDGEPVFDEPWQAQALAMADTLVTMGKISAIAWGEALGAELRKANDAGAPDSTETYYCAVVASLEHLLDQSGTANSPSLDRKNNSKGYTPANCQVITAQANRAKGEWTQGDLLMPIIISNW